MVQHILHTLVSTMKPLVMFSYIFFPPENMKNNNSILMFYAKFRINFYIGKLICLVYSRVFMIFKV